MPHRAPRPIVLALDDEPLVLRALVRELGQAFQVLTAHDPDDAVEHLATTLWLAGVVCDLNPGIDGAGLCVLEMARERHPRAARVLVSGAGKSYEVQEALRRGLAHEFIAKPWERGEVLAALDDGNERTRVVPASDSQGKARRYTSPRP